MTDSALYNLIDDAFDCSPFQTNYTNNYDYGLIKEDSCTEDYIFRNWYYIDFIEYVPIHL